MTIPNNPEFSVPQLMRLLQQVEKILGRKISAEEWQKLRFGGSAAVRRCEFLWWKNYGSASRRPIPSRCLPR